MDRPLRLLIVSDTPDDRVLVMRELHQEFPSLQVTQIGGEESLAQTLAAGDFDLVITDSRLRGTDGPAVVRAVKAHSRACPVIMFADGDSEPIILEAVEAGLDGYTLRSHQHLTCLRPAMRLVLSRAQERQAMKEAELRYRSLFDRVPMGLYRSLPDGQIVEANTALVEMLGYPDRESLLAINAIDLYVHAEDRARWRALLEQGDSVRNAEMQLYRHDGSVIWVENNARAIWDQAGRVLHYEGFLKDITRRKQAQEALRESEERFRTIVEQSPISIQVLTPDGWTLQVNRAWEKLWGVTAEDVKSYNMLNDEQTRSLGLMPYVERGFAGEAISMPPVAYDTQETVKKGRKRWFQARIYPVKGTAGEIRNVIMMYEDITERKWAEEDLQKLSARLINAQEAERKRISQELHDEIGQALTAMRINLAAMEKELPPDLAPKIRERLTETGWLADQVLEQLRELSLDLRPTMLDDLGLVPTLRWYVNRFARRIGIEVEFEATEFDGRLAAEIETTLYRVAQEALTNIARHAQARRVRLSLERAPSTVSAYIEDDGIGFEVQKGAGVEAWDRGMGLLGMRERVTLLGGSFLIESSPEQGTRLWIEVPLRRGRDA